MSSILVTGGAGFVGSSLVEALALDVENTVVIIDNLVTGSANKIPKSPYNNIKFIKADANIFEEIASVFYNYRFDYVFHYAALVGVMRTLENPIKVLDDITGIKNILSLSKNTGVKRVFYSSSSEVYGEPVEIPQHEITTPLNSRLPYAIVKNVGEAFLKSFYQEYNLPYTTFRFFNTYGPKQSKDFVVSKFLSAALKNNDLYIHGNGLQTRTFCYIDDNVQACLNTLNNKDYENDTINIGGDNEITIMDLAKTIIDITGATSKIINIDSLAEGDMTRRCPDNTKMRKLLNKDLISLHDGIQKLLANTQYIL